MTVLQFAVLTLYNMGCVGAMTVLVIYGHPWWAAVPILCMLGLGDAKGKE